MTRRYGQKGEAIADHPGIREHPRRAFKETKRWKMGEVKDSLTREVLGIWLDKDTSRFFSTLPDETQVSAENQKDLEKFLHSVREEWFELEWRRVIYVNELKPSSFSSTFFSREAPPGAVAFIGMEFERAEIATRKDGKDVYRKWGDEQDRSGNEYRGKGRCIPYSAEVYEGLINMQEEIAEMNRRFREFMEQPEQEFIESLTQIGLATAPPMLEFEPLVNEKNKRLALAMKGLKRDDDG